MSNLIMLLDANSIGHAAQNGTKLTVGDRQTQAIFGFLRTLRNTMSKFPGYRPIVLWDDKAHFRFELFPGYKDRTGKNERADAERAAYEEQRPEIKKGLYHLGVTQMRAPGFEADDLAYALSKAHSKHGRRVLLVTGDADWKQMVDENIVWYEHRQDHQRTVGLHNFFEDTGCKTPQSFVEAKAMQGDSSDTIPGIGGLGEKGAAEFLAQYGSVYNFLDLAKRNELPNRLPAAHRRLRDNEPPSPSKKYGQMLPLQDAFERNMQLMDLSRAPKIEPNGINKASGVLNEEAFGLFCQQHFFNSIIGDPRWLDPFRAGV